jgi:hypothetical protein
VEVGKPVIHLAKLLYAFAIGSRTASALFHRAGDTQKSFGRIAVKAR